MAYQLLVLSPTTPPVVQRFIRSQVDMQFHDIHCMLRLPLLEHDLGAGCNFASANVLLAIVSGLSALLTSSLDTSGKSGVLFKRILLDYYPWDVQPPQGSAIKRSIDHLYQYFRNPLAHSLGIKTKGNFQVAVAKTKDGLSEADIERLENLLSSPGSAISYTPIIINNEQIERITLNAAVIAVVTLLLSSGDETKKSTNTPSATIEGKTTKTLSVGDEGILNWHSDKNDCTDTTPVAVDKEALSRMLKLADADDTIGLGALVVEGRVFNVKSCTKVKVIDRSLSGVEIRVMDGSQLGKSGWVVMEFVK